MVRRSYNFIVMAVLALTVSYAEAAAANNRSNVRAPANPCSGDFAKLSPANRISEKGLAVIRRGWTNDPAEFAAIRTTWTPRNFTDPRQFDRNNFRLIVQAVRGPFELFPDFVRNYASRKRGSATLLTNELRETIQGSRWGVIVDIPPENIIATAPFDMASRKLSDNSTRDFLRQRFGLHTPDELIRQTQSGQMIMDNPNPRSLTNFEDGIGSYSDSLNWNRSQWNEIKFQPESNGAQSKVRGLFIFRENFTFQDTDEAYVQRMQELADELGIPLIVF